jgi:hypothetical protein
MNHPITCWTDSEELNRFPDEVEEESPLTLMEQRIEWLFHEWEEAVHNDTHDAWYSVRMVLYGATQALNQYGSAVRNREDREAIRFLFDIAFQHGRDCIAEGKYE